MILQFKDHIYHFNTLILSKLLGFTMVMRKQLTVNKNHSLLERVPIVLFLSPSPLRKFKFINLRV